MPRLLIAGYGFLGEALEARFLSSQSAEWSVDKLSRSGKEGCVKCDISSSGSVSKLSGHYDLVIHCAASGGGGGASYRSVYLEGARNLLAQFPEARFIFTSSSSVYAQTDHSLIDERSLADPITPTAKVLKSAEDLVLEAGGTIARLSGLYGPGRCHVLKNFLAGTAHLDGEGERIMNFIHRDDVAEAMLLLASNRARIGIYNVTSEPVSQFDCYQQLADHFDQPMPPSADASRPRKRGNSSKRVSNNKMKGLGWAPKYEDFLSMALKCKLD